MGDNESEKTETVKATRVSGYLPPATYGLFEAFQAKNKQELPSESDCVRALIVRGLKASNERGATA